MTNLEVVQTWYRRVYEEEDLTAIDEMIAQDTAATGLDDQTLMGPEGLRQFVTGFLGLVGGVQVEIVRHMEDGPWVHTLLNVKATDRRTNTPVAFSAQVLSRVQDGKLVQGYNTVDFLAMFSQLGLLPSDVFARCMGGTAIA